MGNVFGFLCVCALCAMPAVGCSEDPPVLWDTCRTAEDCNQPKCHVITCTDAGRCEYDYAPSVVCDDGNDCTLESCAPDYACEYEKLHDVSCDFNGRAGFCIQGVCHKDPCEDIVCDDGNDCTSDFCDRMDGSCKSHQIPICEPCDRNGVPGACIGTVCEENLCEGVVCDDDNLCTDDECDCQDGTCRFRDWRFSTDIDCWDGDPCTDDECDPDTGCYNPVAPNGQICGCLRYVVTCPLPFCFPAEGYCAHIGHCQNGECV